MKKKKMIKKLIINNFQIHKNLTIKFDDITTITGASDVGKSSIIRALRWLVFNRPVGDSFIHKEAKKAFVILQMNKDIIQRTKGTLNTYHLNKKIYTAFGKDIPSDIIKKLNLSEINFQGQHEAPFWLSKTPGEVSKQLNEIVNLEIIDFTLSNLASLLRRKKTELNISQTRMKQAIELKKDFRYVRKMDKDFQRVESISKFLYEVKQKRETIQELCQEMIEYKEKEKTFNCIVKEGRSIIDQGKEIISIKVKHQSLQDIYYKIYSLRKLVKQPIPDLKPLENLLQFVKTAQYKREKLLSIIEDLEEMCKRKKDLEKAKEKLHKMIGKTCPLCGQKIK